LQTGGTTAVAIDTAQIVTLSKSLALLGSTSGSVALAAPATAGAQSYTLPTGQPTADGLALTSTKVGAMSWAAVSATPAGSDTQVQYNNGGTAFGAASTFTFNNSTGVVTATGFSGALNGTVGATTPAAGTFTTATARAAATQDSVVLQGRAGGTSSYAATITPTTLTASRTVTLPDASINFATGLPVANGGTGATTANSAFNALAPSQTSNSGKYLTTDGSNTSWATVSGGGSPGGSNTQVQYNNSGAFGGSANFTFNGSLVNVNAATTTPTNTPFVVKAANTKYAAIKTESSPTSGFVMLGDNASATESFGTASIGYSGAQFVLGGCVAGSDSVSGGFNSTYASSANGAAFSISGPSGVFQWWNSGSATSTAVGSAKSLTNTMTLDQNGNLNLYPTSSTTAAGNLLIGTSTAGAGLGYATKLAIDSGIYDNTVFKNAAGAGGACLLTWNAQTSGNNLFQVFITEGGTGTARGTIKYDRAGGLVQYNTTSDYRAKDIYGPVTNSGEVIDSVPVYMGKMKDATLARPMFIAHETPVYAHTGEKDAVKENGEPIYQEMDVSALVPVLWAEVKSLRARLAALEAK
jgi:hypothetical protein